MRHVVLVVAAVAIVLLLGLPLGSWAFAGADLVNGFSALGIIQTVPSIALFGLLIGPLTSLGQALPGLAQSELQGSARRPRGHRAGCFTGFCPLRSTSTAICGSWKAVSPAVIDAARGNGMRDRQILVMVTLPLALPVLSRLSRSCPSRPLGLLLSPALISAGGLGTFVFQGSVRTRSTW